MSTIASPSSSQSIKRVTTTIHDELTWGMTYRNQNSKQNGIPLQLACSPVSVHRCSIDRVVKKVCIYPPAEEQPSRVKKRCRIKQKCVNTTNLHAGRVNLLNRSILNQKDYMRILAVPNVRCFNKPRRAKRRHRCILDRCSPRIVKLSLPKKTHVLATWKDHEFFLSSEVIQRLHDLLHTDNNINIRDVRYYFKKFDKKKRKLLNAMKLRRKRKEKQEMMWIRDEVRLTSKLIVDFFIDEPLLDLSFKQLLISSTIMCFMGRTGSIRQTLTRNVKKTFPLTVIEICDKLAVWMDSVVKLVDFQPIDDEEEFPSEIIVDFGEVEGEGEEVYGMMEDYEEEEMEQEGEQ